MHNDNNPDATTPILDSEDVNDDKAMPEQEAESFEELILTEEEHDRAVIRSDDLDSLLVKTFNGRIVRKDLTKQLKTPIPK